MLAIAIWLGTLGYAVFYYGERLWVGVPVTIVEALWPGGSKKPAAQ